MYQGTFTHDSAQIWHKVNKKSLCCELLSWPEVIKLFFMLNSAEHEISPADKYENANNSRHFHIL